MRASATPAYRWARTLRAKTGRWLALSLLAGLSGGVAAGVIGLSGATAAHGDTAPVKTTLSGITAVSLPTVTTTVATTASSTTSTASSDSTDDITDSLVDAEPAIFDVADQQVSVTFPPGSVSQAFGVRFSTQAIAGSKSTKLRFESVEVYLNHGVPRTSKVRRHGKLVTTTVYEPNATMKSVNGLMEVSLANIQPGTYTCKVQINYQRKVAFQGVKVTLPYTSTITEPLTVTG